MVMVPFLFVPGNLREQFLYGGSKTRLSELTKKFFDVAGGAMFVIDLPQHHPALVRRRRVENLL